MEKVRSKHEAMVKAMPPGEVVPYADGLGRVYRLKMPAASLDAIPASTLPEIINVYCGPDVRLPIWRRYLPTKQIAKSNVVAVSNLPDALYSELGLLARLHGCRLADMQWLRSKMKDGQCLAFSRALSMHLYFWLTPGFCEEFPSESRILLEEAAGSVSDSRLVVCNGNIPDKPKHPRLSFEVVRDADLKSSNQVSYQGLLAKLSNLRRC